MACGISPIAKISQSLDDSRNDIDALTFPRHVIGLASKRQEVLELICFQMLISRCPFDLYEREDGVVLAVLVLVVAHTVGKTGRHESGKQEKGPEQGVAGLVV